MKAPYALARAGPEDFVAFKHTSKLFTAKKTNANNILDKFSMHIFVTYLVQPSSSECSGIV